MNKKLFDISFVVEGDSQQQSHTEPADGDDPGDDEDEADDLDGDLDGNNNMETDESLHRPPNQTQNQTPAAGSSKPVGDTQKARTIPMTETPHLDQFQTDQMVKTM